MNLSRRGALRGVAGGLATAALASLGGCGVGGSGGDGVAAHDDGASDGPRQSTFFAFNTVCVVGGDVSRANLDAAVAQCMAFEHMFSRTIATSDVARVNAATGAPTTVDRATAELVAAALDYRDESDGVFDVTIGAVSELWDFAAGVVPSADAIAAALPHVGGELAVDLAASTVTLADPAARIDLGGIAKGYVADAVIAMLAEAGASSAYVNLGGNVAVLGAKAGGEPWSVGVRNPFADAGGTGAGAGTGADGRDAGDGQGSVRTGRGAGVVGSGTARATTAIARGVVTKGAMATSPMAAAATGVAARAGADERGPVPVGVSAATSGSRDQGAAAVELGHATTGELVATIATTDGSVVTSGLYERGFERDGRRYWHILDPRTGYPVATNIASVTVASSASIDGDGYTKPPFFMGANAGLDFLASHGVEGLVVTTAGEVLATPGSGFVAR